MSTDSNAVSGLIRLVQTRRLQTQPGDEYLFQPRSGERPRPRASLFAVPAPAPAVRVERPSLPPTRVRPRAPARSRKGLWIATTLLAGAVGLVAAAYYPFSSSSDDGAPAVVIPQIAPPAAPAPAPAPPAAVSPAPAPAAVAPVAAPKADEAPAAEAPAPAVAAPATPAPAATPHHRRHVKPKKLVAKRTAAAAPSQPAAAAAPPAPHPTRPARPVSQSDDNENPL